MEEAILDRSQAAGQTPAIALFISLFGNVSCVLRYARVKSVARRTAKRWPSCPEDLMPFGPERLTECFSIWSRILPDTNVFFVAAQCIELCCSKSFRPHLGDCPFARRRTKD
ncbi:hypothetical protein BDN70DRAFT_640648 [Pholiota conissans]|uniref:Uncharacterized protein n=1 Tax=Pholiota conissans TaxID=109636 RepID=A0A9P5Z2X8_9AGAR|nr:hypothetical protein BDN70DRAFT_640648 [Pholiota conissans]